jgi:GNAT superfamily N-acetyltransferase
MEWKRDNFTVTTDQTRFDMDFVVASLQGAWRKGAARERIASAFGNSLSFGLFDGERQIGCVRAVTDCRFVSWVCDLFLDPACRGKGLGRWLMDCVMNHPDLAHTRLVLSSVPESRAFYESIGFTPMRRGYAMPPRGTDPSPGGDPDVHRDA